LTQPLRSIPLSRTSQLLRVAPPLSLRFRTLALVVLPLVASPLASESQVPTFRLTASLASSGPSRPGELHPEPLTDPDVNLAIHPARATHGKLPLSGQTVGSSGCPLTQSRLRWPTPFAPRELPRFLATTKQCAPVGASVLSASWVVHLCLFP